MTNMSGVVADADFSNFSKILWIYNLPIFISKCSKR